MAMTGYTKLFNSILASTIWREDDKTRLVWITLLAMADQNGLVEASIPGLADLARVSIEDCERALENLQKPDKYSRSHEHDGRRIDVFDGGWIVLNHAKYRDKMSLDDKRERDRERQRRHRKQNNGVTQSVTDKCDMSRMSRHTEAEADTKADKNSSSELKGSSDTEASPDRPKKQTQVSQEADRLAVLLKTEIFRNKPDYRITPAQERQWAQTADRMIRLDNRKPERIAELIRWAQGDEFWMSNILSMDKLREKFDALELKACGSKNQAPPKPVSVEQVRTDYHLPADLDVGAGQEIWRSALGKLAARINQHSFDTWLRPCKVAGVRDRTLYVKLPTVNFSHVSEKYATLLAEVLPELKVEFVAPTPLEISKPMDAILEVARGAAAS